MSRYADEAQALADGYEIVHQPGQHNFVIVKDGETLGHAHYTLLGDDGIDFDGTFVEPSLRGTGLSGLLAARAVGDEIVRGRKVRASCWYIEEYLERHPEALAGQA